jgi:hypothetical protein
VFRSGFLLFFENGEVTLRSPKSAAVLRSDAQGPIQGDFAARNSDSYGVNATPTTSKAPQGVADPHQVGPDLAGRRLRNAQEDRRSNRTAPTCLIAFVALHRSADEPRVCRPVRRRWRVSGLLVTMEKEPQKRSVKAVLINAPSRPASKACASWRNRRRWRQPPSKQH